MTLNINRHVSRENSKKMFGNFCFEVDRTLLGHKNVQRVPNEHRLFGIAFVEHVETNIHLHAAVRPEGWQDWVGEIPISKILTAAWSRVTKGSGTIYIEPIRDSGWIYYMTKEAGCKDGEYILANDFHPNRN